MVRYAGERRRDLVVTECGLSDKLLIEVPEKHFYKACKLCQYMKMITLDNVVSSLEKMQYKIELDEDVRVAAKASLERMLQLSA
jgi:quinolinate synthase